MNMVLLSCVILVLLTDGIRSRVVKDRGSYNEADGANNDNVKFSVDDYLERYGYLKKSNIDSNVQHSEDDRKHAIRMFQQFAGLPDTGQLTRRTVAKMKERRCGVPDIVDNLDPNKPMEYTLNDGKWKDKTVTWRIQSFSSKIPEKKQRQAIINALKRWEDNSGLIFLPAEDEENADINILFATGDHGDSSSFDGPGGILAHAFSPENGGTHFDDDEDWTYHNNRGTEFEITATHELGHALGLSHTVVFGSVMVPFYQSYRRGFQLHADDIAGIQHLYGPPKKSNEIPDIVEPPTKATTQTPLIPIDTSICSARFNAITRGPEGFIHLFIGSYIYKLKEACPPNESCVIPGYPQPIKTVYKRAPRNIGAAAFIPDERQWTYFFKGRSLWRFTGYKLDRGYPKRFNKTIMPYKPTAAYIHKNQFADYQLYLFAGKHFWEMNIYNDMPTTSFMKVRQYWTRMPSSPDAMVQTRDGFIYVFKGKYYSKYDHLRDLMVRKRRKAPAWLGGICRYAPR